MEMHTDKKLLFFDIDGTLITDDGRRLFPESAKRAIRMARERGHKTFINSGRVLCNIEAAIRDAGFDGYVCGCGTYIEAEGRELLHHRVSHERCQDIARWARACGMMAIYEHTEHTAYDSRMPREGNGELIEYFRAMNRKMIDDIESPEFVFDKFTAWYNDGNTHLEEFRAYLEEDFTCIKREGNFLEIVPKGFSKATGIGFLLNYYNVPPEQAYAFGDSNNDLDMLRYVPNSIAMGVCTPEVAKAASYQTSAVCEDGIYHAMKHFGVIE